MNQRQQDLFMWVWSQRRKPWQMAIGLRGAGIGALGGALFTLLMSPGAPADVAAYDTGGQLFGALGENLRMLGMAVPAFALIGWLGANGVFMRQEAMYQALLTQGARVPDAKPQMELKDRGPALAVAVAVVVIAGFIVTLFVLNAMHML